ncbi:hypothetical protein B0H14DRAFT_3590062 [Mycena olivaceomarginata]|nr:hypothetical protein B0H14DRAFT_3590062 [Mycena olivaceomarginata]
MFDLVKYDDHTPGKLLPAARGTLFSSRPEAVASKCLRWFALNLMLFLLPLLGGSLAMLTLGARLGIYGHKNPHQLAYMLTYFAICSGSANVFIASLIFPRTLRYHLVIPLILGRRRHRSHFSFMSNRRLNRVVGKLHFTVFIMGFRSRSFPVVVDSDTTVEEIYSHLQALGIVPGSQFRHFYFTYRGRRIRWDDTIGRAGHGATKVIRPKASTSRPSRAADRTKMKNAIADDIAVKDTSAKKRRRKTGPMTAAQSKGKGKAREDENTDPEDDDFLGSGSDGETSDEDSDSSIEILNSRSLHLDSSLAESLPTKTIAENARRSTKAPPRKKRKGAEASSSATAMQRWLDHPQAGQSTPSQQPQAPAPAAKSKKSNSIYLFYEDPTDCDAKGEKDEGAKYYKCYLGNREIVKLTKGSNQNTNSSSKVFKSGHRSRTLLGMWDHRFDA